MESTPETTPIVLSLGTRLTAARWIGSPRPKEARALEIHPAADFRLSTQSTPIMAPERQFGSIAATVRRPIVTLATAR